VVRSPAPKQLPESLLRLYVVGGESECGVHRGHQESFLHLNWRANSKVGVLGCAVSEPRRKKEVEGGLSERNIPLLIGYLYPSTPSIALTLAQAEQALPAHGPVTYLSSGCFFASFLLLFANYIADMWLLQLGATLIIFILYSRFLAKFILHVSSNTFVCTLPS